MISRPVVIIVALLVAASIPAAVVTYEVFSKSARGHIARGDKAIADDEYLLAAWSYRKALLRDDGDLVGWVQYGYALSKLRWFGRAAAAYERGYALSEKKDTGLLASAGLCYEWGSNKERAEERFREASKEATDAEGTFELIRFLIREKRYKEAETLSLRAKSSFERRSEPYLFLAVLKMNARKLADAYSYAMSARERAPESERVKLLSDKLEEMRARPPRDTALEGEISDGEYAEAMKSMMKDALSLNRD